MAAYVRFSLLVLCLPLLAAADSRAQRELNQVLASSPDVTHGAELFEKCAACHGADGGGTVNGSVPRIAGQHYRVLAKQIIDFRQGRRWDIRMEGVATSHEVIPELQDVTDVATYVSRLERAGHRGIRDGQYLERGAGIYAKSCSSCHGADGAGNDKKQIPRIAGQHADYLARQIYDAVDGRRPELSKSHGKRFAPLDFEDVLGLTDYLARLGWQP